MKTFLATLAVMFSALVVGSLCYSQQGIFPGTGSGTSGFPITIGTTAIGANGIITTINGLLGFQNIALLSPGSEIGAQCNTAVTALGAAGGLIVLPNSTALTITTTCANIPQQISIKGYGKSSTIMVCSVVGDCLQFNMNPTTQGEIGGTIADFQMRGSGTGQVLLHAKGMSGYTLHDLQFEGYNTGGAATCLEFDNATTGQFTEGNRTYNVSLERTCTVGVLFNQNAGDSSNSFGYNFFEFHVVCQNGNWCIQGQGTGSANSAFLYNGSLIVYGNHVGPNGGILNFINGFSTDLSTGLSNERLYVAVEENGSGAGTVINVPGSGSTLRFYGNVINGAFNGSGTSLATPYNVNASSQLSISTDVLTDTAGNYYMGSSALPAALTVRGNVADVGVTAVMELIAPATFAYTALELNDSFVSGGTIGQVIQSGHFTGFFNTTDQSVGFGVTTNSSFATLAQTNSLGQFCWSATAQFINGTGCDTGISRISANVIGFGNGTQGDRSAELRVGKINVATARKGTFVCTAGGTITITNANEAITSDVVISLNTAGGTISTSPAMKTVTAATGFTVLCGASDTSTYNYDILN